MAHSFYTITLSEKNVVDCTTHIVTWVPKWMECRSTAKYLSSSFNRNAVDIQFSWRFIGTELKVTFLTSLCLWFVAEYFQFQWVVHLNMFSCDEQKYTYIQLKLVCLQPIEWRILHFFGILRFPKRTELLQSAIHFSSIFDEKVFDISFFRRFHFWGMRKTTSLRCFQFLALAGF
jgi:hypothetical protein